MLRKPSNWSHIHSTLNAGIAGNVTHAMFTANSGEWELMVRLVDIRDRVMIDEPQRCYW